jgi:TolA-binding protein
MWFRTTSTGFILIFFFIVLLGTSHTNAQNPDKTDKEAKALINRLQNQLKEAERDLQKAQLTINNLKQELQQSQTKIKSLQAELQKEKKEDQKDQAILKELDALRKGGYIHVATYKLKAEAPSTAIRSFIDDAQLQLLKIKGVRWLWVGERDGNSALGSKEFHVALTVILDDPKGLKAFQDDPIQKQFWKKHEKNWEPSLSYDFLPKR